MSTKATTAKNGWKICSRGHKYRGAHCQTCWKLSTRRKTARERTGR